MSIKQRKMTLFSLSFPIFVEVLLHMLMGNADTLMLSQYNDDSVAAVGVANQIMFMVIMIFGFIASGTMILVSQSLGAKDLTQANEIAVVSIVANLLFGLAVSVILYFFSQPLLAHMHLEGAVLQYADDYVKIVGIFVFTEALLLTIGAVIRSHGFTKDAMYVTILMNLLHVIGNYIALFGPFGLPVFGVEGVAWSTSISRLIGLAIMIVLLFKRVKQPFPFSRAFQLPFSHLKNLLKIGVPSAGEQLSYNGSQFVILFFIIQVGTQAVTTRVYTQNIMMFVMLSCIAIAQGTQILIAHYFGAKEYESVYKRCLKSLKISICISFGMACIVAFFSESLIGIFTENKEIIAEAKILLYMTILLEPGRAFNVVIINSLRAVGDVQFPLYMAIVSMWGVSVVCGYVFGVHFDWGLIGFWMGFILDEWVRGIAMLWRWRQRKWLERARI